MKTLDSFALFAITNAEEVKCRLWGGSLLSLSAAASVSLGAQLRYTPSLALRIANHVPRL